MEYKDFSRKVVSAKIVVFDFFAKSNRFVEELHIFESTGLTS